MGYKLKMSKITRELLECYKSDLWNGDRYINPCTLNELVNRLISIKNKEYSSDYRVDSYTKQVIKQYLELVSTKNGGMSTNWDISRMPPNKANKSNKWDLPRSVARKVTFYEVNKDDNLTIHHFEHNLLGISCEFIDHLLELYIVYHSEPVIADYESVDE